MRLCFPVTHEETAAAATAKPAATATPAARVWQSWKWTATTLPDGRQLLDAPSVRVEVGPLTALRDQAAATQRIKAALSSDEEHTERLPGQSLHIVLDESRTSNLGWPMRLIHAVLAGPDESVLEHRLCVFYRCFGYGAEALIRVREAEAAFYLANQDALLDFLQSAHPDWSGDAVPSLRDLFQ